MAVRQGPAVALVLALAGSWAITEWLRATMFTGFAWNPVGAALVDSRLLGASRWIGTYGLSALVVLSGGALWLAWKRALQAGGDRRVGCACLRLRSSTPRSGRAARRARSASSSPISAKTYKWRPGFERIAAARLDDLTRPRAARQELIFWPEAAVTDPLSDNRPAAAPWCMPNATRATAQ